MDPVDPFTAVAGVGGRVEAGREPGGGGGASVPSAAGGMLEIPSAFTSKAGWEQGWRVGGASGGLLMLISILYCNVAVTEYGPFPAAGAAAAGQLLPG